MFKPRVLLIPLLFPVFLAACASTYPVQFQPQAGQEVQQRPEATWLLSQKTHRVELASAYTAQAVHQPLRLKLRVRNGGKAPVQFGPEHVRAQWQGKAVAVLGQEAQLQAAQQRLDNAQRSQGFEVGNARVQPTVQVGGGFGAGYGSGSGVGVFASVGGGQGGGVSPAGQELERAKVELQRARQQGLNSRQLNPGEWAEGEVELDAELTAWQQGGTLVLEVRVAGELHTLQLAYSKAARAG